MLKINLSPRESDPAGIRFAARISAKLNLNAAGIDIGASEHWVCVPAETTEENVRCFGCFTPDLEMMADWLISCGVETVAMESTSVDWIPVFQMLEARGLEVFLINAHHVKTVPGRKSDVRLLPMVTGIAYLWFIIPLFYPVKTKLWFCAVTYGNERT